MKRLVFLCALAAVAFAAAAAADSGRSVQGRLVEVGTKRVAVKDAKGVVTSCALGERSPSLGGYLRGDRVQVSCAAVRGHLVLAKIRRVDAPSPAAGAEPVTFAGAVTALTPRAISLRDGDRALTCAIAPSSPSTAGIGIGTHVRVACTGGVLVKLAPVAVPETSSHTVVTASGTVTAVSSSALTVHNAEHGDLTCSLGASSPSVRELKVGDAVTVACSDGVLVKLARPRTEPPPPAPTPEPSHTTVTAGGTLAALSTASVTVHNAEHGDLTCAVGSGSPRLGDFKIGDRVLVACVDGVLAKIARV